MITVRAWGITSTGGGYGITLTGGGYGDGVGGHHAGGDGFGDAGGDGFGDSSEGVVGAGTGFGPMRGSRVVDNDVD